MFSTSGSPELVTRGKRKGEQKGFYCNTAITPFQNSEALRTEEYLLIYDEGMILSFPSTWKARTRRVMNKKVTCL